MLFFRWNKQKELNFMSFTFNVHTKLFLLIYSSHFSSLSLHLFSVRHTKWMVDSWRTTHHGWCFKRKMATSISIICSYLTESLAVSFKALAHIADTIIKWRMKWWEITKFSPALSKPLNIETSIFFLVDSNWNSSDCKWKKTQAHQERRENVNEHRKKNLNKADSWWRWTRKRHTIRINVIFLCIFWWMLLLRMKSHLQKKNWVSSGSVANGTPFFYQHISFKFLFFYFIVLAFSHSSCAFPAPMTKIPSFVFLLRIFRFFCLLWLVFTSACEWIWFRFLNR